MDTDRVPGFLGSTVYDTLSELSKCVYKVHEGFVTPTLSLVLSDIGRGRVKGRLRSEGERGGKKDGGKVSKGGRRLYKEGRRIKLVLLRRMDTRG